MSILRSSVFCVVVAAAAFHLGMSSAAALPEQPEVGQSSQAVATAQPAAGAAVSQSSGPHPSAAADEWATQIAGETTEVMESVPLGQGVEFPEVVVRSGGVVEEEAGDTADGSNARLIYSNTLGIHAINFPTNLPISDDISTTAPDGCNLRNFKFKVLGRVQQNCVGGVNNGLPCTIPGECPGGSCPRGGAYSVNYALYTNCPFAVGGSNALHEVVRIPGTIGEVTFSDDGPRAIKHVVDQHNPVAIPTNVYLGIRFNRPNCGTVVGAPAMIGFSGDVLDYPGFPCRSFLGGFPQLPHASFWLEMYGSTNCPPAFAGYKCQRPSSGFARIGANIQGVDDIKLQVENCRMVGYEVAVRGVGFYRFDLRRECEGEVIPGTEKTFQITASTTPLLQIARFTFDPPILLPDDDLYLGFKCSSNSSGAVIAGVQPIIGSSSMDYSTIGQEGCEYVMPIIGVHGAVNLAITCAGDTPVGACCDMALLECQGGPDQGKRCSCNTVCAGGSRNGRCCSTDSDCVGSTQPPGTCEPFCAAPGSCEAVCRELPEMNCPWPPRGQMLNPAWVEGGTCESNPFPHTCGLAACCKPDDTCENLTKNDCEAVLPLDRPRLWQAGSYCGQDGQSCPFNACLARDGDCRVIHEWGGCSDPFCCAEVCAIDPWCCHVEWDRMCLDYAALHCVYRPINDDCGPYSQGYPGAVELAQSTPYYGSNIKATRSHVDGEFCCNADSPGTLGEGTVWFKFVATHESAQIDTCASEPEGDTLVDVFSVGDPTNGISSCESLSLIGCGDNDGCPVPAQEPASLHSRFCVDGLTVGNTYYIMLASKTWTDLGTYEIEIKMPCQYLASFPSGDCNENGTVDGCELAERTSRDCDYDGQLDECESAPVTSPDCDKDGVIDTCGAFRQRLESASYTFGSALAFEEDLLMVGDPGYANSLGGVHTYERDANGWFHSGLLISPDVSLYTSFGVAIAASGQRLVVLGRDSDAGDRVHGRVFAYRRSQQVWLREDFPNLTSEADSIRVMNDVIIDGDLAAVKTSCYGGPQNCNLDVTVHMFRRTGSQWNHDGIVPIDGSFKDENFAFDLDDGFLAVSTKGKHQEPENSIGSLFVFEQQGNQWVKTTQRDLLVENVISISFSDSLIAVGGTNSEWKTNRQLVVFSLYRKREGSWDQGGTLNTWYETNGVLPRVAILSPVSLAITVSNPGKCPGAAIFQRTSYTCDWCGYWFPLSQLNLTHCGSEPRTLTMDAGSNGVAIGIWGSSSYGSPDLPPGSVQVFAHPDTDCDASGASDLCEIQAGLLEDCNNDQAADICQARGYYGDYDLDLSVTLRDFAGLQNCFTGNSFVATCCGVFDDSSEQGIDLFDVGAFVGSMTGP